MIEIYVPHILPIYQSPYPRWRFYISPHPLVVELWCVDGDDDVIFFLLSCSVDLFLEGNWKGLFVRKYPIYSYYTLSCRYYGRLIYITKCRRNSWAPSSSSCHHLVLTSDPLDWAEPGTVTSSSSFHSCLSTCELAVSCLWNWACEKIILVVTEAALLWVVSFYAIYSIYYWLTKLTLTHLH